MEGFDRDQRPRLAARRTLGKILWGNYRGLTFTTQQSSKKVEI